MDRQALEARLRETTTAHDDLVSELNLVVEDRAALAADLQRKSATLATVQNDLHSERERAKAVEASLAELRAVQLDLEGQHAAVNEERAAQMLMIGELRTALEHEKQAQSELKDSTTTLEEARAELEVMLATAKADGTERQADFDRLLSELDAAQQKQIAAKNETDALRAAQAHDQATLDERTDELKALNSELFAAVRKEEQLEERLLEAETNLVEARAESVNLAIRNRTDAFTGGDNVRKALAAAEAESAELASKLAALEKDHAALRAENHRIQSEESVQVVAANGGDEDLRRRLREIADGVLRLTKATELGETPVPTPPVGADIEQSLRTAAAKPPSIVERAPPRSARRNLAAANKPPLDDREDEAPDGRTLAERLRALQQPVARP